MCRRAGSSFMADQCSFHHVVFHREYFHRESGAVLGFIVDSIRIIGLVAIVRTTLGPSVALRAGDGCEAVLVKRLSLADLAATMVAIVDSYLACRVEPMP